MTHGAYSVGDLADRVGARVAGDAGAMVTGLGSLATAQPGDLTHLSNPAYRRLLPLTRATVVLLRAADLESCPTHALIVGNPYLAFARLSQLFTDSPAKSPGIHSTAVIHGSVRLGDRVTIGANVSIGARCSLGNDVVIGPNCVIGDDCVLADGTHLMASVTLYHRVHIGARSLIHSGAVLGADGFGFVPDEQGRQLAIAQIGGLVIGSDVSIGAATTIDRGAIDDTIIGDGVKIDNQVQIGHNCVIGEHTVICGCVGIVGSTRIGRHCVLAGGVGVGGDRPITIADRVVISGMTHVSGSIAEPGVYSGGVLHSATLRWKRNALRFGELDELAKRIARLEKSAR